MPLESSVCAAIIVKNCNANKRLWLFESEFISRNDRTLRPIVFQINYSDMLNRIEPLRNELGSLEQEAKSSRLKNDEMQKLIGELESSIAKYKEEYALLISQAQAIKSDLASVETKVCTLTPTFFFS